MSLRLTKELVLILPPPLTPAGWRFLCVSFYFFFFSLSKSRVNFCLLGKKIEGGRKRKKTLTDSLNTSVASPSPWGVRKTAPAGFKARKMLQSAFKSIAQNSPGR